MGRPLVRFTVEREGSRLVVAARDERGQAFTLNLHAAAAGALASNLWHLAAFEDDASNAFALDATLTLATKE